MDDSVKVNIVYKKNSGFDITNFYPGVCYIDGIYEEHTETPNGRCFFIRVLEPHNYKILEKGFLRLKSSVDKMHFVSGKEYVEGIEQHKGKRLIFKLELNPANQKRYVKAYRVFDEYMKENR